MPFFDLIIREKIILCEVHLFAIGLMTALEPQQSGKCR
jgi:hypothetical protein